ncbi:protein of unknown function [Aminobacter niigataensis]|nr:protein of unknown function [Aminobacter niigataensis]
MQTRWVACPVSEKVFQDLRKDRLAHPAIEQMLRVAPWRRGFLCRVDHAGLRRRGRRKA